MQRTSPEMLEIAKRCLDGCAKARAELWAQVEAHIRKKRLPELGRFSGDLDARRDIFVAVMVRIEADLHDFVALCSEGEGAAFWTLVDVRMRSRSIDYLRSSRQRLSPRGADFRWSQIVPFSEPDGEASAETTILRNFHRGDQLYNVTETIEHICRNATDQRAVEALLHRLLGRPWSWISQQLSYPSASAARMAMMRMLKQVGLLAHPATATHPSASPR
jgi:hypothetical protein